MEHSVVVGGVPIRYRVIGRGSREIVLIHGHLANSMWWHMVVHLLDPHWRLVLVDLSGHGDSGHRESYSLRQWADDVVGVLDDLGSSDAALAAHSLGGSVAIAVAAENSSRVSGVVLLDTYIPDRTGPRPQLPERSRSRVYPTLAEARSRFRLMPLQPPLPDAVIGPVVENAVRATVDGWTWKFDGGGTMRFDYDFLLDRVAALDVPVRYIHGEHSAVVTGAAVARARTFLGGSTEFVEVAGGHHHIVLDHAEQCAELIDEFVNALPRSRPEVSVNQATRV